MAYCSQTQLEDLYGADLIEQLTDDSQAGAADADLVTAAITDAGREIDGYCGAKYAVPFSSTPPLIVSIALDLSIYRLYRRRAQAFGLPEHVDKTYAMRIKQLEKINAGTLDLGVAPPPTESTRVVVEHDGPDRMFLDDDGDTFDGTLDGF